MTNEEAGIYAIALGAIRLVRQEISDDDFMAVAAAAGIRATDAPLDMPVVEATQETVDRGFDAMVEWLEPRVTEALS